MFVFEWVLLLLMRVVLILLGLAVVPLALPFRDWSKSDSDGRGIVVLPRWAWLWSNDFDGSTGDKRGWWASHTPFGLSTHHWFSQFWWLAIRNPVNNLRKTRFGSCPVQDCFIYWSGDLKVRDRKGGQGTRMTMAKHRVTGKKWYGFYMVHEWSDTRAFVIRLGFKIEPWHENGNEPPKGFTFKINPWKSI